jgi:hypothetical protein
MQNNLKQKTSHSLKENLCEKSWNSAIFNSNIALQEYKLNS